MPMGESAGRTSRSPLRAAARRRMSDEERAQATALVDDPQQWPDTESMNHYRIRVVVWALSTWCSLVLLAVSAVLAVKLDHPSWLLGVALGSGCVVALVLSKPERPGVTWWS